jgi:hypothetical protein
VAKRLTGVPLKKEGEFVSPHPCKEANGAHCRDQTASNVLEARVPRSLTIPVIDIAKVVEVYQNERSGLTKGFGIAGAFPQLLPHSHPAIKRR